jgi:hypothetical protein
MEQALANYLFATNQCSINGLGTFIVETQPATFDVTNQLYKAGQQSIVFFENPNTNGKNFEDYISLIKKIDKASAITAIKTFTNKLKSNQVTYLNGLGTFTAAGNILHFKPEALPSNYSTSVHANRVIYKNQQHNILVGETTTTNTQMQTLLNPVAAAPHKWWLWALLLALAGIATIAAGFYTYGTLY